MTAPRVLINVFHPDLAASRANRLIVEELGQLPGASVRDIQMAYPDSKIDVAKVLGKKATCLRWYYLNEQTGIWVYQGQFCADPETGFATVPIEHFSRYGAE